MKILITGAAGNLGGLTSEYLLNTTDLQLNLLIHKKGVGRDIAGNPRVSIFRGNLADKGTLYSCLKGVDVVIHYAGVLFRHNPEKFLPETNTQYFKNLCDTAIEQGVRRIILISFPHVEGETTPDRPATGRLDRISESMHARTRLEEEKYLFEKAEKHGFEPVSLRVGMVYGNGILMIDAARWLAKRRLLGVWKKPTWIHLISKDDFLVIVKAAVLKENITGIYHAGDEGRQTLQDFFDIAARQWECPRPWIMPLWMINLAAEICELQSRLFNTKSPLTRDFIKIGMQSYYGDTKKMRRELLENLKYPTIRDGYKIL